MSLSFFPLEMIPAIYQSCSDFAPSTLRLRLPPHHHRLHLRRLRSFSYSNPNPSFRDTERRLHSNITFALNPRPFDNNPGQEDDPNQDTPGIGQTRLSRILIAAGNQLLAKLNSARNNFPTKVFLLLLGFYTANALATILGQTGDWDVLVAGIVVAAIEGIGMLMYKRPPSSSPATLNSFILFVNYWKAGVCLGLFVDAFKLGS